MTEDQDAKDSQSDSGGKIFTNKTKEKKTRAHRPFTKIILRRLPPTMTEEGFLEQVSPIPEHDYFYFSKPDSSLGTASYSRAYINFVNVDDIYLFRDKFDGYVFVDEKGVEYVGIVEYAPFQRIPKKKKKRDPKIGTIESDPIYQEFVESLKEQDNDTQPKLEYSYPVNDANEKKVVSTPLLEFLAARKTDKRSRDERRRRENDKRKMRIERKSKDGTIKEEDFVDNEVKKIKPREWEKDKTSPKAKDDLNKSLDSKESTVFESKTYKDHRKFGLNRKSDIDKKDGTKEEDDFEKGYKKEKKDPREKLKEIPKEQKSKKYSDIRKERLKQIEIIKSDRPSSITKLLSSQSTEKNSDSKKNLNHDNIKPFTQLPQVKTDDLSKVIEEMDRKMKLEDQISFDSKAINEIKTVEDTTNSTMIEALDSAIITAKIRSNSLESGEMSPKDDDRLRRQKSLDDRSTDREGSVEKDKGDSADRRAERRIRNKDRPSLVIYQPGMGKFSKQRLAKEKESQVNTKSVSEADKDT
ncbi:Regulator of nonsense transcripts 3A [Eumeta japonica]|uniref:Regulator of nonsense transcripts 3A n=1 Tax=Eumeta variegata TaxID=151549 RepID=A0A4C1UQ35_EUMVA|nr:Regulator of nonsense transcripts 3A [Eumeta japonica]